MIKPAIVVAVLSFASIVHAQQAGMQAAQAAQMQEEARRAQEQAQTPLRLSIDPARIVTVGLWPGSNVPCKLPKRDKPYVCHRLLVGPAVILSRMTGELVAARGDAALAKGERSWWVREGGPPMPLGLAAGEVLYQVGDEGSTAESDRVVTVYR